MCGSTPQGQPQSNSFSRHSSTQQEPPWHRADLAVGSSQETAPCQRLLCCCLPSGSDGGSRQIAPARLSMNEALWNWLPAADLSPMAHSPHLWLHGFLLSQKLQQEGAAVPSSLCPLWEISDISQEWKQVLSITLQARGT